MQNKRLLAALGALALGIATVVWGDYNTLNHSSYYQNATNGARVNSTGSATVEEQYPPALYYSLQPSVISSIMVPVPDGQVTAGTWTNKDSTSVIDCRGYNRAALYLFPSATLTTDKGAGSADSLAGTVFALQVRGHYSTTADSQSTFRIIPQRTGSGVGGGIADSLGSLSDIIRYSSNVGLVGVLRSNALPSEKAVVVANIGGVGDARGQLLWSSRINDSSSALPQFVSWRLRALNSYTSVLGNATVRDTASALPMRVRVDLVLWRE